MLQEKFKNIRDEVGIEVLERSEEIHTALLAIVSRTHHFQLGAPGVAKSLLVDKIIDRIEMPNDQDYFKYLMQNFTLPDEVFGPPNIAQLVHEGVFKVVTDNKLPVARIAFLDEIFKANSSILNTLLLIINEREFVNPNRQTVPLMSLFSASNELPGDNSLMALWDRLHFRHEVHPLSQSSSFMSMLEGVENAETTMLTFDEIEQAQDEATHVGLNADVYETMNHIRLALKKENIEPTGRRWKEALRIIRASAWMNGNTVADISDIRPLIHVLWSEPDHRRLVAQVVLETVSPLESQANKLSDNIELISKELSDIEYEFSNDKEQLKQALVEVHKKLKRIKTECDALGEQAKMAEKSDLPAIKTLDAEFKAIGARMVQHFA